MLNLNQLLIQYDFSVMEDYEIEALKKQIAENSRILEESIKELSESDSGVLTCAK